MIPIIDAFGEQRFLMQPHHMLLAGPRVFGDDPKFPLIAKKDLIETPDPEEMPAIKDQDGIGACNPYSTVTLTEFGRARMGLPYISLSPGYLYGSINHQQDQGSGLQDAVNWMLKVGTVTSATIGELVWQKGRWPKDTAKIAAEAASYRLIDYVMCPTVDHIFSAVHHGWSVGMGINWKTTDDKPDQDGWLQTNAGAVRGGHAFPGYGIAMRNGELGLKCQNQWGTNYGVKGRMVLPYDRVALEVQQSYGIWAIKEVTYFDPTGKVLPPVTG